MLLVVRRMLEVRRMLKKQKRFNKFDIITELQGQSGKNEIQLENKISLFSK